MPYIAVYTFELRFGTVDRFEQAMGATVPAMVAQGWRLISATRALTGAMPTVRHVWEIPSVESLSTGPAAAVAADESLPSVVAVLADLIASERVELTTPMGYDPSFAS